MLRMTTATKQINNTFLHKKSGKAKAFLQPSPRWKGRGNVSLLFGPQHVWFLAMVVAMMLNLMY